MSTDSLPPGGEPGESSDPRDQGYILATFVYDSRNHLVSVDLGDGRGPTPAAPLFDWEHLADKRLFALTENGKTEYWRDNPTRFLVVEPDPETGMMKPATTHRKPVYLWICREEREPR